MDDELKQLRLEITQLQALVAVQGAHIALLLAVAKQGAHIDRGVLELAIDSLELDPESGPETKKEAKKLMAKYFPSVLTY